MEREYLRLYKHYSQMYGPNTCVFYMVGKFYEMYDSIDEETNEPKTSMKRAAELLNIQLSTKDNGSLFAGVPEQSLHKFAAVLTRNNWTVVVCDQVKDTAGKVTGRPTARILSPGTHYEVVGADAPFVGAVWLEERDWQKKEPPAYGLAFFDLTTGITTGFEGEATGTAETWSADSLVQAIQIHNPKEIVVFWRGDLASMPKEQMLRTNLGGTQALIHLRLANAHEQGGFEKEVVREDFLKRHYNPQTMLPILEYLHMRGKPNLERGVIGLLRFMEDHLPSTLERLQAFQPWTPHGKVHMGNNALTQLNMISNRIDDSVLGIFQKTLTAIGKRGIRNRILLPISDIPTLQNRFDKIEFLQTLSSEKLEKCLKQLSDFPRIHRRITEYSVNAADVADLYVTYERIKEIAVMFHGTIFSLTGEMLAEFMAYCTIFQSVFDIKKTKLPIEDNSFLDDTKAPQTAAIEGNLRKIRQEVEEKKNELCKWAQLNPDDLHIDYGRENQSYIITGGKRELTLIKKKVSQRVVEQNADDRVIEVNVRRHARDLPRHDGCPLPDVDVNIKKTGGGTVETSYLDSIHNRVLQLRQQLAETSKRELMPLCDTLVEKGNNLWDFLEQWISDIDVSLSIAKVSQARGFCKPQIVENSSHAEVNIKGLRHPLIETTATKVQYVQHDIHLGGDTSTGWLVYGMNASGKSSLMKALGISVLLAQTGCFVPARSMEFSPFRSVLTRILNQDNLWAGLSSFAVEMTELRDILTRADPFSLVLGDELCSGTESVSATALVASGIHHLLKKESRFIFATHLHGLIDLPEIKENPKLGIWHLKVKYDAAKDLLIYDRTLHRGPGLSIYGIEVARALHLPNEFLETAQKIRRSLTGEKVEEELSASAWNSDMYKRSCSICGSFKNLEAHHIRPRSEADGKLHFEDGSARDALSNLRTLCSVCHDKHHAGELEITPMVMTSAGAQEVNRVVYPAKPSSKPVKQSKWTDEEKTLILDTLRNHPNVLLQRIQMQLKTNHDIDISETELKAFRKGSA